MGLKFRFRKFRAPTPSVRRVAVATRVRTELLESRQLFCGVGTPSLSHPVSALPFNQPASDAGAIAPAPGTTTTATSVAGVPALSSRPGARATLYLDFNGEPASHWGGYEVPATPAYSRDGDAARFGANDLAAIREVFARVAEKYSPFDLNVTTVDPGSFGDGQALKVVVGGDGAWTGRPGGTSYVGAFVNWAPNTVYVFPDSLFSEPKFVGEAAAHEAGHAFGLEHQSAYAGTARVDEYNAGTAAKAPVMGRSYDAARGLWWKGASFASDHVQDDLAVIASLTNGFGYRRDDHGGGAATATAMAASGTARSAAGVIEAGADADFFSFATAAGTVRFDLKVAAVGATLDAKIELRGAAGALIKSVSTAALGETFSATVGAGTYTLAVRSQGGYGDLGQYTLSGTVAAAPQPPAAGAAIAGVAFDDANGNGTRDAGEPGLANRRVFIDADKDGTLDAGERITLTDATGRYAFGGLPAGTHRVREVGQSGWRPTSPAGGYRDVAVGSASAVGAIDFGNTRLALLSGTAFNDRDADGTRDAGEGPLPGRHVYVDLNANGHPDPTDPQARTDAAGGYRFALPAGTYTVRQMYIEGFRLTSPTPNYYQVALAAGAAVGGRDFGYTSNVLITGAVFDDADGDRYRDPGEAGLANWRVFVDLDRDGRLDANEPSKLTDVRGDYAFTTLPAGSYRVRLVQQGGWAPTSPSSGYHALFLQPGWPARDRDFGQRRIA